MHKPDMVLYVNLHTQFQNFKNYQTDFDVKTGLVFNLNVCSNYGMIL